MAVASLWVTLSSRMRCEWEGGVEEPGQGSAATTTTAAIGGLLLSK